MTKNIEWLRKDFDRIYNHNLRIKSDKEWDKGWNFGWYEARATLYALTIQLDESETKQLEQRINVLENELKILDSYIANLKLYQEDEVKSLQLELEKSDNKIIDLEYDLFLEKTRGSKHSFYWFTAKKTPFVTDVSYMSKDNHFYGFKQPPNYNFIEFHDLRFVTNCPLDDLIEQFR